MASSIEPTTERNRQIVRDAFDAWASGSDQFFDIVARDVTWLIAGSGLTARAYHGRQSYIDEVMRPLQARFSSPIVPRVQHVWADGDYVIVRWEQNTPTRDGMPYCNSYAWFFKMLEGEAVEVTAFLDHAAYDALLAQAEPASRDSGVRPDKTDLSND